MPLFAGSSGNLANLESRYIVDMPTAGITKKGDVSVYANAFTDGGLMMELTVGIFQNFNMALSYSATNIIGSGEPSGPDYPGVHLKFRAVDEKKYFPALAIGVSTQGRGTWNRSAARFQTLSPGAYVAGSKNFEWLLGNLALHGGFNYSFEPEPEDRSVNLFYGMEQSLGNSFAFILEINATLDDDSTELNTSTGLANLGIRWGVSDGLTLELQVRDVLGTQDNLSDFTRFIALEYAVPF